MNVLEGERFERRRILHEGRPEWTTVDGALLRLMDGRSVPDAEATYLPPCEPTKILCVHLNYESRRVEFRAPELVTPTFFQKPVSALNSHRGALNRPANCRYLNYEGEIAAIVGRTMKNVAIAEVWDHIAGFAPANDVGLHDFRDTDAGGMTRVKGMDGSVRSARGSCAAWTSGSRRSARASTGTSSSRAPSRRWCSASTTSSRTSAVTSRCRRGMSS